MCYTIAGNGNADITDSEERVISSTCTMMIARWLHCCEVVAVCCYSAAVRAVLWHGCLTNVHEPSPIHHNKCLPADSSSCALELLGSEIENVLWSRMVSHDRLACSTALSAYTHTRVFP